VFKCEQSVYFDLLHLRYFLFFQKSLALNVHKMGSQWKDVIHLLLYQLCMKSQHDFHVEYYILVNVYITNKMSTFSLYVYIYICTYASWCHCRSHMYWYYIYITCISFFMCILSSFDGCCSVGLSFDIYLKLFDLLHLRCFLFFQKSLALNVHKMGSQCLCLMI
jgi:hypothetical protein